MPNSKPQAFVLMPFSPTFDTVYSYLIRRPLEDAGFDVKRADSDLNQQSVLKEFVEGIVAADLVVADLTHLNSNVMYELGLAHALGARVIVITQDIDELPFDLQPYKANPYSIHFAEADEIKKKLHDIGVATINGTADYGNPVQDFAPHALRSDAPVRHKLSCPDSDSNSDSEGNGTEEDGGGHSPRPDDRTDSDGPGFIEAVVELEHLAEELKTLSDRVGDRTREMGIELESYTAKLENAKRRLGSKAAPAMQAIINDLAVRLGEYNTELSPQVGQFQELFVRYGEAVEVISRDLIIRSDDDIHTAQQTLSSMLEGESVFDDVVNGMRGFAAVMAEAPNATKKLRTTAARTTDIVNTLAGAFEEASAETARGRGIIENRISSRKTE